MLGTFDGFALLKENVVYPLEDMVERIIGGS